MASPTLSAKQMAIELGTDARTFRKFMRDITPKEDQPGQGKRWSFEGTKKSINQLKKKFAAWQEEKAPKVVAEDVEGEVDEEIFYGDDEHDEEGMPLLEDVYDEDIEEELDDEEV